MKDLYLFIYSLKEHDLKCIVNITVINKELVLL